jgi:hypothetical protein
MLAALKTRIARPLLNYQVSTQALEQRRLRLLFAVAILMLFNFIGGAWDIQWHVEIGRDSLWIPPHLVVMIAFVGGVILVVGWTAYETWLAASGHEQPHTVRIGPFRAPLPVFAILIGYIAALASAGLDEWWHETFGIDATLWSPPHLLIMACTMIVDYSLILGISASARRLGYPFTWKSPLFWGLVLTGAYAFESVNFQMGEAFIVGFRHGGVGLYGLLYPLMVGAFLPLCLVTIIRLARRFWVVLLMFALALLLQYAATGIAAAGFAILKPVSVIEEYVRQNPDSTAARSREFARLLGFNGLIGFHQAWTMTLSAAPLALVSCLEFFAWARRRPFLAAPIYSAAMVLFSFLWFKQIPALKGYPISGVQVLLAILISVTGGLLTGVLGMFLTAKAVAVQTGQVYSNNSPP